MPAKPNERVSPELTEDAARELLHALPDVLRELLGSEQLVAQYGWAANLHIDLCWKPMKVATAWLDRFIRESLEPAVIVPGKSDFIFEIRNDALRIEVCHDGHLHVSGTDQALIDRFVAQPPFSQVALKLVGNPNVASSAKAGVPDDET